MRRAVGLQAVAQIVVSLTDQLMRHVVPHAEQFSRLCAHSSIFSQRLRSLLTVFLRSPPERRMRLLLSARFSGSSLSSLIP